LSRIDAVTAGPANAGPATYGPFIAVKSWICWTLQTRMLIGLAMVLGLSLFCVARDNTCLLPAIA